MENSLLNIERRFLIFPDLIIRICRLITSIIDSVGLMHYFFNKKLNTNERRNVWDEYRCMKNRKNENGEKSVRSAVQVSLLKTIGRVVQKEVSDNTGFAVLYGPVQ